MALLLMQFLAAADDLSDLWLSTTEYPGMHILRRDAPTQFSIFRNGLRSQTPLVFIPSSLEREPFRTELQIAARIAKTEPMQNTWEIYSFLGDVASEDDLHFAPKLAVYENGNFQWPPVEVGYKHVIPELKIDGEQVFITTLALQPALFSVHHFYPRGHVEEIVEAAQPIMAKSDVIRQTADLGKAADEFRTSSQAWLLNECPAAAEFDRRVSHLTRIPASHNEPLQVLRYLGGEFYAAHMDWTEIQRYPDQVDEWRRVHYGYNNRMITIFSYLSDAPAGHTLFPRAHGAAMPRDMKDCQTGLKSLAKAGNVVMWYNTFPNGEGDPHSLHAGCPPEQGYAKWAANKWVSMKPRFTPPAPRIRDHPALARFGLVDEL